MMERVRVLTLNVCGLPWARHLEPLDWRARELGGLLEDSDVDIACFQEVWTRAALSAVRAGLPSFRHVAAARGPFGPSGGLAMFSRVPLGPRRYASFRGLLPPAGPIGFRLRQAVNSAMQGVLAVPVPGAGITVANTHLTANRDGDWSRHNRHYRFQRAQLTRLRAAADRVGAQVLVGDFNLASSGPLYPSIVDGWQDPFAETDPVTFHTAFLPAGAHSQRIDYVLVRKIMAKAAEVVFAGPLPSGQYVTDHIGLIVDVAGPGVEPGRPPS